jgi:hypothetical protein
MATIYTIMIGVNPYVFDDDRSIKSGFKFVKLFGVPLFTTFCHFLSTAELKINEIQIYGYHTLLGVNSY